MADHSKPTTSSTYSNFVSELDGRLDDLALGLDPATTSPTNIPTNAIRWSSALGRWQKWNGSAWGELAATYALTQLSTTGNVRIGASSVSANVNLNVNKNLTGGTSVFGVNSEGQIQSDATVAAYMFRATPSVAAGATVPTLINYTVSQGTFTGTVTDQIGYAVSSGMIGGTDSNIAFWSGLPADGTKNYAFYSAGSAPSLLSGSLQATALIPSGSGIPTNGMYLPAANTVGFATNSAARMRIDSAGNVGIGTSSPVAKVDVQDNVATSWNALQILNLAESSSVDIYLGRGSNRRAFIKAITSTVAAGSPTELAFGTNVGAQDGVERMRINSAGNVGIGTSAPIASLQVGATDAYPGASSADGNLASFKSDIAQTGIRVLARSYNNASKANLDLANFESKNFSVRSGFRLTGGVGSGQATANEYLAFSAISLDSGGAITETERMRIDSAGNLGLGVTPSTSWWSAMKSIGTGRIGNGIFGATNDDEINIGANIITTGSGTYIYGATDTASLYRQVAAQHVWYRAASGTAGAAMTLSESMRIDSSGNVGIGTSSPQDLLELSKTGGAYLRLSNPNTGNINEALGGIKFYSADASGSQNIVRTLIESYADSVGATSDLRFSTTPSGTGSTPVERMRITSAGELMVGKSVTTFATPGAVIYASGRIETTVDSSTPLRINRETNDGFLVEFQQDNVTEGNISVSGTTVSYNGGHLARWSQILNGQLDETIVKGTVLSNLDEMCEWLDSEGNPLPNEQLNRMKVSDVEGDPNVAGVFVNWDNDDQDNPYDMNIAMTGDMIIRIAQGVTVQKGDLLMSAGDGTAKPQGDDIVRSKTIAKVTSNHVTCTYVDGSYCVPCVLMAC